MTTTNDRLREAIAAVTAWLTAAAEAGWCDDDVIHSFDVASYGDRPTGITIADLQALLTHATHTQEGDLPCTP